jgi:hypothetical protein
MDEVEWMKFNGMKLDVLCQESGFRQHGELSCIDIVPTRQQ